MKITIIGAAGYVGSNVTSTLAMNGLADEIVLIDPYKQNIVLQLAMDISTAVAEQGIIVRAGSFDDLTGCHVIIIAAGAAAQGVISSRMELLPKNLPIIKDIADKIKGSCPDAIVITATNPVDALNYAMFLSSGFDRQKVIGYSTNDSIRFRMMMANTLGTNTSQVEGFVLGEHGESQVLLFSSVRVKGKPVPITDGVKQKIRSQVPGILKSYEELRTNRTAGWTSAVGMKAIVGAIRNNTNEIIPCSVVLDGEYGCRNLSMGVPAVIGSAGVHQIIELKLASDEQQYLKGTLELLEPAMRQVEEYLGISKQRT